MSQSILLWIISAVIAYVIIYLLRFYSRLKLYPNGPIPIPLLGNILLFRGDKRHPMQSFMSLCPKYGSVYTFWMGNDPFVFIFDADLAKEAFNKSTFSGRPQTHAAKLVCNELGSDVVFADYCQSWECLRRVSHSAVRKYAVSEKLTYLASEVTDDIVEYIIEKEGIGNAFDPSKYTEFALYNIIASSAFGKKYTFTDPEFLRLNKVANEFFALGDKLALVEFVSILRIPLIYYVKRIEQLNKDYTGLIREKFNQNLKTYQDGSVNNFAESLIAAKNEAIVEGKESAPYLTDHNLSLALWDLFVAGVDTSVFTFQWMLLLMANYPEVQQKLRQEINDQIGDRIPVRDDSNNCHYVNAFISETLRFRNVLPLSVPHKTTKDVEINGYKIPANTTVVVHQFSILNNPDYWPEPQVFRPERFLENGQYVKVHQKAFIPFGIGRRKCLGERLAMVDLFLVLVRFLQSTNRFNISLANGPGSADLVPNPDSIALFSCPKPYKIVFNKI